jgi:mRNA-degrading endonuclease RelE of RelBE toxin-antitoxin system
MVFSIFLSPQALNDLKKLNNHSQRKILISIEKLAEAPPIPWEKNERYETMVS